MGMGVGIRTKGNKALALLRLAVRDAHDDGMDVASEEREAGER